MLPYLCFFLLGLINFTFYENIKKRNEAGSCFFLVLSIINLIFFSSLRSASVGTDTRTYLAFWNSNVSFSALLAKTTFFSEFGFELFSYLTKYLSAELFDGSKIPFLMFISSIVLILTYSSIIKYSENKTLSLFCFLMLGFYTFHFNGARQAIAIAIFLFSLRYVLNSNPKKYFACLFVGFLFHKSILICMPFYYFFRQPLSIRMVLFIVLSSVVMALSVNVLVDFASGFDRRYSGYASRDFEGGGVVSTIFYIVMLFWLYFVKKSNNIDNKLYDISLLSMLIVSCIGALSVALSLDPSGILRLSAYFSQFLIFALPISIYSFKDTRERLLVLLLSIIFMIMYFYLTTTSFSNLAPYRFGFDMYF
ncbi:EpsG family protein [Endozoicomonas acroporae]|uniref:EpsG family protein n=1 Tax=Endozoicomonas acroporae TaxID=1701104 RepID=UPI003D793654